MSPEQLLQLEWEDQISAETVRVKGCCSVVDYLAEHCWCGEASPRGSDLVSAVLRRMMSARAKPKHFGAVEMCLCENC